MAAGPAAYIRPRLARHGCGAGGRNANFTRPRPGPAARGNRVAVISPTAIADQSLRRPALRVAHRLRRLAVLDDDASRRRASLEREVRSLLDAADEGDRAALLAELASYFPTSEDDVPPAWWHAHLPSEAGVAEPAFAASPDASTIAPPPAPPPTPAAPVAMPAPPEPAPEEDGLLELDEFEPLDDDDNPSELGDIGPAADEQFNAIDSAAPEVTISPPEPEPEPAPPPTPRKESAAPAPVERSPDFGDFTLIDEGPPAPAGDGPNYADQLDAGAPEEPASLSPLQSMPPAAAHDVSPEDEASELLARLELLRGQLDDDAWQRAVEASGSSLGQPTETAPATPVSGGEGLDLDERQSALTERYWKLEPKLRRRWELPGRDVIDPSRAVELADALGPHVAALDGYVREVWKQFKPAMEGATSTLVQPAAASGEGGGLTQSMLLGGLRSRSHLDGRRLRRDLSYQLKLATGIIAGINGVGPRISDRVLKHLDPEAIWSQQTGFGESAGGGGGWLGRGGDKEQATKARCWDRYVTLFREVSGEGVSGEVVRHIVEYVEPFLADAGG